MKRTILMVAGMVCVGALTCTLAGCGDGGSTPAKTVTARKIDPNAPKIQPPKPPPMVGSIDKPADSNK